MPVMIDWSGYDPYMPLHLGPLRELSSREAKQEFEHLMSLRAVRLQELASLVEANGVNLGDADTGIQDLDDWLRVHVSAHPKDPGRLEDRWYGVLLDIGLYLGEELIARQPQLQWSLVAAGPKSFISYHQHVISGFTRPPYPGYVVDLDRLVSTHVHQIVEGLDPRHDEFVSLLSHAETIA